MNSESQILNCLKSFMSLFSGTVFLKKFQSTELILKTNFVNKIASLLMHALIINFKTLDILCFYIEQLSLKFKDLFFYKGIRRYFVKQKTKLQTVLIVYLLEALRSNPQSNLKKKMNKIK